MKQIIAILLLVLIESCSRHPFPSERDGQLLPSFSLSIDSVTKFNTSQIETGKPFLIFLFQPSCPYCRAQTVDILNNMHDFNGQTIYMISDYPASQVEQYVALYHLEKYPNIKVIRDPMARLMTYFKASGVPYLAFYDEKKKLKEIFPGKVDYSVIKSTLAD